MHVPDGLLTAPVALASAALSAACVATAAVRSRTRAGARATALRGVMAAFVFAAQMLNFPVAGGTSGHLVGGALAAVLLGPAAAIIVMTAVLVLQCLVFADGGLLALGANVLDMGVIHPVVGYALYRLVAGRTPNGARRIVALAFGSWGATLATAATCAGQLALARVAPPGVLLSAILGSHVVVGAGEAIIGALVLGALQRVRPELLTVDARGDRLPPLALGVFGLSVALALALFVTPFACSWPDGLEQAFRRIGVVPSSARVELAAPLRDYSVPGLSGALSTSAAALLGTLLVFAVCVVLGRSLAPRREREKLTTAR